MENWRLRGLVEAARNLATGLENMAGEHVDSSPPPTPGAEGHSPGVAEMEEMARPPLSDWWRRLNQLEARLQALEAGQAGRPITDLSTADSPSDAEPCQHLRLGQWVGHEKYCPDCKVIPAAAPDSPTEPTAPLTPLSSQSGQEDTKTYHVELDFECVNCPACGVSLRLGLIPVQDAPPTPST